MEFCAQAFLARADLRFQLRLEFRAQTVFYLAHFPTQTVFAGTNFFLYSGARPLFTGMNLGFQFRMKFHAQTLFDLANFSTQTLFTRQDELRNRLDVLLLQHTSSPPAYIRFR